MRSQPEVTWFLREWREYRGLSQEKLADAANTSKGYISDIERGNRGHSREMAARLAEALNVTVDQLYVENPKTGEKRTPKVPLVGFVHAGDSADFSADLDNLEYVDAPRDTTPDTRALQIKGDSLGRWYSGWLVYFDDVRTPVTDDQITHLCVVGLDDGRVLLKVLERHAGGFVLRSQDPGTDPIYDAPVAWAARVKGMSRR